jgi:hypothetical protein
MLIVPIQGDSIKTKDGLPSKVLSYSNYKTEGPAVLVEGAEGKTDTVFFQDIEELNDQKVTFVKSGAGYKVFEITGFMEREFQLPQPGETVSAKIVDVTEDFEVTRLRLHIPNEFSRGLVLDVLRKDGLDSKEELTLGQITDVEHYLFSRPAFLKYYDDYREKGSA